MLSLSGPNGAGETTLIRVVSFPMRPPPGKYWQPGTTPKVKADRRQKSLENEIADTKKSMGKNFR